MVRFGRISLKNLGAKDTKCKIEAIQSKNLKKGHLKPSKQPEQHTVHILYIYTPDIKLVRDKQICYRSGQMN